MEIRDFLSDDGQVVLALCSAFGSAASELEPLRLSEWNQLARQIEGSSLKTPAALHGLGSESLLKELAIAPELAERIGRLLERSARLALELESLFAKGMWAVTKVDEGYPPRLRQKLRHQAPSVLFGAGDLSRARQGGVAVVGSRNIDEPGIAFARAVGRRAALDKMAVISGGAKGSDRLAMTGALEAEGVVVGVLADSLERTIRQPDVRDLVLEGRLTLLTPYVPTAGFSIGGAMGRNKIIYGLAECAVVVSSDFETGGTWAGAVEALKAGWCPVFVRESEHAPQGNRELLKVGATALPEHLAGELEGFAAWLRRNGKTRPIEQDLFSR